MIFTVDPAALHAAATKFTQLSQDYTTVYNRLLNSARNMGDAWSSADNQAFVEQINGLCEELKAMATHLETASKTLDQQATNYEQTRDNNSRQVKQLKN